MKNLISRKLAMVICIFAMVVFSCQACSDGKLVEVFQFFRNGLIVKKMDAFIHFYGRVLDQEDLAVEGARVSVSIRRFSLGGPFFMGMKKIEVFSDVNGRFEVFQLRGSQLFIDEISREGYEFIRKENRKNSFTFKGLPGEPKFNPDKDNPVTFRLRKRHPSMTYLLAKPYWGIGINSEESGIDKAYDFVEQKRRHLGNAGQAEKWEEECDLRYRAILMEETGEWEVEISACGADGGIFPDEEKRFEAPVEGYRDQWSFRAEDLKLPENRFLYLRSRSPAIYSRVELEKIRVTAEHVRIYGKSATNPYGDRVLDSVDMDTLSSKQRLKLKRRLKSEAQGALREGRLPERPKIMALIEAAKRGEE